MYPCLKLQLAEISRLFCLWMKNQVFQSNELCLNCPSQQTDDVTRGELPRHNKRLKHLNDKIHRSPPPSSESFIPTQVPSLVLYTQLSQYWVSLYHLLCVGGPLQLCEMVRVLSLSDVIITAASLKPLGFLPWDSPQLPYPETGHLTSICPSVSVVMELCEEQTLQSKFTNVFLC